MEKTNDSKNKNKNPYEEEGMILEEKALRIPIYEKLKGKRIVLASGSPRRLDILRQIGINPEQIESNFKEDLNHDEFNNNNDQQVNEGFNNNNNNNNNNGKAIRYATATATEKVIQVYTNLVEETPERGPDLVIGADTILFKPSTRDNKLEEGGGKIIEKPKNKSDHLMILEELIQSQSESQEEGSKIQVITGVSIAFPSLISPGYSIKTFAVSTNIFFVPNLDSRTLQAYVEMGEGFDKAGGFSIQGVGCQLIQRIEGDWNNVVGFPAAAFIQFIQNLMKEDEEFLAD